MSCVNIKDHFPSKMCFIYMEQFPPSCQYTYKRGRLPFEAVPIFLFFSLINQ